jgi:hypothetical protein
MPGRTGFGDETWRLALIGDVAALERAGALLLSDGADHGGLGYDGHRALAFALAVAGRVDDALAELNEGWTEEWPFPSAYAADVARVRFLGGDYRHAIDALRLASRSADVLDPAVADLAVDCVRRSPGSWLGALKVVLAGGSPWRRARSAVAVVRARL